MAANVESTLQLGNFIFYEWEIPEEIKGFGRKQVIKRHDFPGGDTSVQAMGDHPEEEISWSGIFWSDYVVDIKQRLLQLDQMCEAAQPLTLTIDIFSYQVLIKEFTYSFKNQFMIPYTLVLVPYEQTTAGNATQPQSLTQSAFATSQTLANNGNAVNTLFGPGGVPTAAAATFPAIGDFNSTLQTTLTSGGGLAAASASPAIASSLQTAQAAVNPLLSSSDPATQAYAIQTNNNLTNINNALTLEQAPQATLQNVSYPDLSRLAIQYFNGDQSQWQTIAKANGLSTPNPQGVIENLVIPAQSA